MSGGPGPGLAAGLTIIRLTDDPLARAGDPDMIAMREDLGARLAGILPAKAIQASRFTRRERADQLAASIDLIVQHADAAVFAADGGEGQAAYAALAAVIAVLASQPGGVDFAGRHWCARHESCGGIPSTAGPAPAAPLSAARKAYLRKHTGSYYTSSALVDCLLESTVQPQVDEALKAPDPAARLLEITVCDPACGAGVFLVRAARMISWYLAMYRAGAAGRIDDEIPAARHDVVTRLIHGVDLSPLAVDLSRLVTAATGYLPGHPNPYTAHHLKCGNGLLGVTPALLARGIPDAAYKVLPGDNPALAAAARRRNRADREAWQSGLLQAAARTGGPPLAAMARAARAATMAHAHRELENAPEVQIAKRVADAWCAAFVWPHSPGGPDPVTTGTLIHLAAGGRLAPEAEEMLAALTRQYQFFHWHLEFPGIFRAPARAEAA